MLRVIRNNDEGGDIDAQRASEGARHFTRKWLFKKLAGEMHMQAAVAGGRRPRTRGCGVSEEDARRRGRYKKVWRGTRDPDKHRHSNQQPSKYRCQVVQERKKYK